MGTGKSKRSKRKAARSHLRRIAHRVGAPNLEWKVEFVLLLGGDENELRLADHHKTCIAARE